MAMREPKQRVSGMKSSRTMIQNSLKIHLESSELAESASNYRSYKSVRKTVPSAMTNRHTSTERI